MFRLLFVISAFAAVLVTGLPSSRVVNGEDAKHGQFPYQALVYVNTAQGTALCGGVLLNHHYVLTAAHCVKNAKSWEVHLGAHKRSLTHEPHRAVYKTTHGKAHPDYNQRNLNNDVGLLYFEEEVKYTAYVQPATVYAHHVSEDRTVVVSGWGLMNDQSSQPAETLQFAPLVTMKNKDCAAVYSNDVVKETVVCAKGVTNESACNGDSGGPLVLEDTHELVGVVSFGHAAGCEKGFPNGYSRVNSYLDWLEEEMNMQF